MKDPEVLSKKDMRWQDILNQIDLINKEYEDEHDPNILGMDPKIKETVAALMALGFVTRTSCEGHVDKGSPYPYVKISSHLERDEFKDQRYKELWNKATDNDLSQQDERVEHEERTKAIEETVKQASLELQSLLEEFYKSLGVATAARLRVNGNWLEPDDVEGTNDDMRMKYTPEEIEEKLKIYQEEMKRFTQFLKDKFYNS
jgi:hypothetical protein